MAFESLTEKFKRIIKGIRGQSHLTEANMDEMLKEVRVALLEADVNFKVVKSFVQNIKEKALGEEVYTKLNPSQMVVKIVHDELVELLGSGDSEIKYAKNKPTVIMMVGLQGTGKTTTAGKLAYLMKNKLNKKVLLAAGDIYRPGAIDQLSQLGEKIGVEVFSMGDKVSPVEIATKAREKAFNEHFDVLIIDTAGRLHNKVGLMNELKKIKDVMKKATPVIFNEAFWVISMTVGFAIYGRLGTSALAVVQVASTITDIFIACYCGLANAGNVIIGQNLGQGNREEAYFIARKVMKISWILNIVSTLIAILSREFICSVYGFSAETSELLMKSLLVYAILLTPRMMAYVLICGILRAGGDTTFSMLCDAGFNWIIQVPLILLAVKMGFPLPVCLAFAGVSEVCKTVASYIRIIKKKWMNVFTGR